MTYSYRHLAIVPVLAFAFIFPGQRVTSTFDNNNNTFKDSLFDMCVVMPGDEVASLSPFNKPIKLVTADDRLDGYCGCHYDLQSDDDFPQVKISVNQFLSAKESKVTYVTYKNDWINLFQREPEFIPNLGDSANFQGNADPSKCDDCGLQVASGRFYIMVAFKGYYDQVSATTKRDAAIRLVQRLFQKKPYLNNRRTSQ